MKMQRVTNKRMSSDSHSGAPNPKRRVVASSSGSRKSDSYCWSCNRDGVVIPCELCPRSFHLKCVGVEKSREELVCPECESIMKAETVDSRSVAMKSLTVDQFCSLLKFSLSRLKHLCPEEFQRPVPLDEFPNYPEFIVYPMDLETLENNVKKKAYGCTESFLADVKWILHNCIVFNGYQHKLTGIAKNLVKVCKHEMNEIEVCPDCYYNAYTKRENWFQEPCCPPHLLIWAKLKGFPFWPAKAMKIASGMVDVRFFGAHDRAWIPVGQCVLLSADPPASKTKVKRKSIYEQSMEELAGHIVKLKENYNAFQYANPKSPISSEDLLPHVETMLPGVNVREIRRSFMSDRFIQPKFYPGSTSAKLMKDEKREEEEEEDEEETEPETLSVSKLECLSKSEVLLREKLESASVPVYSTVPTSSVPSESGVDSENEQNPLRIHLRRTDSPANQNVWEPTKAETNKISSESQEAKDAEEENSNNRNEIDVHLAQAMDSFFEEEEEEVEGPGADTVHVQMTNAEGHIMTSADEELEEKSRLEAEEEEARESEAFEAKQRRAEEKEEEVLASLEQRARDEEEEEKDEVSSNEGELVIDLDPKKSEPKENRKQTEPKRKGPAYAKVLLNKGPRSLLKNDVTPFTNNSNKRAANNRVIYTSLPKMDLTGKKNRRKNEQTLVDLSLPRLHPRPALPTHPLPPGFDFRDFTGCTERDRVSLLEMERMVWVHHQEIAELKHNSDLVLLEMRNSLEYEKQRAIAEVVSQCQLEKQKAVEETKRKQWCSHCGREASFYCCWNTSYCDFPCQQAHWPQHCHTCAQKRNV